MSDLIWRLRDNGKNSAWPLYDEAADRIGKLERENEELAAHNERYRVFVERFCEKIPDTPETHWIYPSVMTLKRATRFTPQASLAEVRSSAIEEAANKHKTWTGVIENKGYGDKRVFEVDYYLLLEEAAKIRNGKDGE